jgi:S1-C subfamily serine protease
MDNIKINKFADLQGFLGSKRPGDQVKVTVLRDNQNKQVDLILKNQFGKESFDANDFTKSLIGDLKPLGSKNANKFDLDYGMEITSLNNKTLYSKYGVENGDMVLAIEDQKVTSEQEVEELLRAYQNKDYINVLILKQNGTYGYVRLRE